MSVGLFKKGKISLKIANKSVKLLLNSGFFNQLLTAIHEIF